MPNVVTIDGLTAQERTFVEWFAQGLTQSQAAQRAGYKNPHSSSRDLMDKPAVRAAVEAAKATFVEKVDMSRTDIVEGMKKAIGMAEMLSDPQTMIVGYRELARMCGYYEPVKQKIEVTVNGNVRLEQMAQMSDDELLKLIENNTTLEGESTRLDDE